MTNKNASILVDWICRSGEKLVPFEQKFIEDIKDRLFRNKDLSPRQGEVLQDIYRNTSQRAFK